MQKKQWQRLFLFLLVLVFLPSGLVQAQKTALDEYVNKADSSYKWKVIRTVKAQGATTFIVDMTSQTWRSKNEVDRTEWQHWLIVVKPDIVRHDTGLLMIAGGSNGHDAPSGPDERTIKLAIASQSVVTTLKMVPNQPLIFHGDGKERVEDDLVAYTWNQFLKTGDPTWPAYNPMVKSAVRAMGTVTSLMAGDQGGELTVDKFVVAGGSKRGWTTWITGAVDQRVVAIIPIVIDVLNVQQSMRHHYAAYGFWAPSVGDYVHHKVFKQLGTPAMERLAKLVDPYCYRERLAMPKFIMNASGDQFFAPDSSQFYLDDLKGEKLLCYFPNADHSLRDTDAIESLLAFYLTVLKNKPRPKPTWSFEPNGEVRVVTRTRPARVLLWQATNPSARDFRVETLGKKYTRTVLKEQGHGLYVGQVRNPESGWTAYFVELTYDIGEVVPFKTTTAVRVIPDTLPFADKDPTRSK